MERVSKPYTFDRVVRIIIGIVVLLAIFFLVNRLSGVLLPFLLGWLVSYMLNPVVNFLQYKWHFRNRVLSIACTLIVFIGLGTLIVWSLIGPVTEEFNKASQLITNYLIDPQTNQLRLPFLPEQWQEYVQHHFSYSEIKAFFANNDLSSLIDKIQPHFVNFLSGTLQFVSGVFVAFLILLYVIFILLDYQKITSGWRELIPVKYRTFWEGLIDDLTRDMNRYFRGQAMVAGIVAILNVIGFFILGLPLAIVMGIFIGILNMVPYLQWFGYIPVVGLLWLRSVETGQNFGVLFLGFAIIVVLIQIIQDIFLVPRIMGKVTGLRPALILLSLSVWGSLLGFVGMIIALPLTTLIISYYKRFIMMEEE